MKGYRMLRRFFLSPLCLFTLLAFHLTGCRDSKDLVSATSVRIVASTDISGLDVIQVDVTPSGSSTASVSRNFDPSNGAVAAFVLLPRKTASENYTVVAKGLKDSAVIVSKTVRSGFIPDVNARLDIFLSIQCQDTLCDEQSDLTCEGGTCVAVENLVPISEQVADAFGTDLPIVPAFDAGVADQAVSQVLPVCAERAEGVAFCLNNTVAKCEEQGTHLATVETCSAPTPACIAGQCGACVAGTTRSCAEGGFLGSCASGTQECLEGGSWSGCSLTAKAADTCDQGNDDTCDGKSNEGCVCINGSSATCAEVLAARGTCSTGMSSCVEGTWSACSVKPATSDSCEPTNDDTCDGAPYTGCICGGFPIRDKATFTVNADDTVTDIVTGLIWERFPTQQALSKADALAYCAGKGGTWRLPTRSELTSIIDYSIKSPSATIDSQAFPGAPANNHWSSSVYTGQPGFAWTVAFSTGTTHWAIDAYVFNVRCVK